MRTIETTDLKNEIKKAMEVEMINYLSNACSTTAIINTAIRPLTSVSEEQEQAIGDILCLTQQEWDAADNEVKKSKF